MSVEKSPEKIYFESNGHVIAGLRSGNKNGPLLLCLHGWLDNAASFEPLMPFLQQYNVIAIDWPGHGQSSHRSDDAHYHFIDWVYDLLQLFSLNNWHNVNVVAHSMGAMVASAFAAAFPERVKSLTLIDAIGFITSDATMSTSMLRKGMQSRLKSANKQKSKYLNLSSAVDARVQVSDLNYHCAELIVKRGLTLNNEYYSWRSDSRLRAISPYRLTLAQAEQYIGDIKSPVQLIYGDNGMEMVAIGKQLFASKFKSLQEHKLQGGHHIHMEQAKKSAELITAFIQNSL